MYLIVVGAGNIGRPLIEFATADANEVVVIENDPEVADRAARAFDCLVLNRDATTAETLEEAGIEKADAVVSTTDRDATNVMVMLLADDYGVPARVSVVHDPQHMDLFRRIGVHTMENPQRLIAEHLYRAVKQPTVQDVLHLTGDPEIFETTVTQEAPLAGLTLSQADEEGLLGEDDLLVVAIERGEEVITPKGGTEIRAGDMVTVFSKQGIEPDVLARFAPEETNT